MNRIERYQDKVLKADKTQLILDTLTKLSISKYDLLSENYADGLSIDVDLHDKDSYYKMLRLFLFGKPEDEWKKQVELSEGTSDVAYLNIIGVHRHRYHPLTDNISRYIEQDLAKELIDGSKARLASANVMLESPPYINTFYIANHGYRGVGIDFSTGIPLSKREKFPNIPHEYWVRRAFEFTALPTNRVEWKDLPGDVGKICHPLYTWLRKILKGQTTQFTNANIH